MLVPTEHLLFNFNMASQVYQGYPYSNPAVLDIPSVSAEEADRWRRLPRRPAPGIGEQNSTPGPSGSATTSRYYHGYPSAKPTTQDIPTISAAEAAKWHNLPRRPAPDAIRGVRDHDLSPQIFVEEPEGSSQVSERRVVQSDQFVQDTIFYDQFKDRRIGDSGGSSGGSSISSGPAERPPLQRPNPPNTLDIRSPDSGYAASAAGSSSLPSFLTKQTDVYGQFGISNTGFEGQEFPQPPPAYTEIDVSQVTSPTTPAQDTITEAPVQNVSIVVQNEDNGLMRTQVIIPSDNTDDPGKRFIECTGCGFGSYGLVVKQSGTITHAIAIFFIIVCFPITFFIYYTDHLKYKNYYCRQCNKLVACEGPLCCQDLEYV